MIIIVITAIYISVIAKINTCIVILKITLYMSDFIKYKEIISICLCIAIVENKH